MPKHPSEIAGSRWNTEQYGLFDRERLQPGLDLLARIEHRQVQHAIDLGCGRGELTELIAARWPKARVVGLDHSAEMLAKAPGGSRIQWLHTDLAEWDPGQKWDLIFSNAALHWLPDHATLFPRLAAMLNHNGCLAVQMPDNFSEPSHQLILEALRTGCAGGAALCEADLLESLSTKRVLPASAYYDLLSSLGGRVSLWCTTYIHSLQGENPVLEWVRGSALRPVLASLGPGQAERFEEVYAQQLRAAYPASTDGRTLFPFRRLFLLYSAKER